MATIKPFQNKFRPELVTHIIEQVGKGETVSLIGLSGIGKSNTVFWIKEGIQKQNKKLILINIDLNNLVSFQEFAFYRLLLLEIQRSVSTQLKDKKLLETINQVYLNAITCNDELLTFDAIKRIIDIILTETDLKIIIIIDSFERFSDMTHTLFSSIVAIRAMSKTRIAYIFLGSTDISVFFPPEKTGELYNLLNYNKHWLRLLNKDETYKLIDEFAQLLDFKIPEEIKEKIYKYSGGHAWYIKILSKIYGEEDITADTDLTKVSNLSSMLARDSQIWSSLPKEHQQVLLDIASNKTCNIDDIPEFLTATELIKVKEEKVRFFSPLFESFLKRKAEENGSLKLDKTLPIKPSAKGIRIDLKKRTISIDGKVIKTAFSRNEFNILKYLFENDSLVVNRDELAEIIWGKNSQNKYSDWAIDKIISRIREKIEEDSKHPKYLLTLRGVGFKFSSSGED